MGVICLWFLVWSDTHMTAVFFLVMVWCFRIRYFYLDSATIFRIMLIVFRYTCLDVPHIQRVGNHAIANRMQKTKPFLDPLKLMVPDTIRIF